MPRLVLLVVCVWLAGPAWAGFQEDVVLDFGSREGVVVGVSAGTLIVDLDGDSGVAMGDLLVVPNSGAEIRHPVTGAVLGRRSATATVLRVTRVRSGYSEAELLGEGEPPPAGRVVVRFGGLPAGWGGEGPGARAAYDTLVGALPDLEWQGFGTAGAQTAKALGPGLVFTWDDGRLEVAETGGKVLHRYTLGPEGPAAPIPSAPSTVRPRFPAPTRRVNLPFRVVSSAFLDTEGGLLLAATDGEHVRILQVGSTLIERGRVDIQPGRTVLNVGWWVPGPEPESEVYLFTTSWQDRAGEQESGELRGTVYAWPPRGRPEPVGSPVSLILGSFDGDGDGRPEKLWGQAYDAEAFFGGDVHPLGLREKRLVIGGAMGDLPRGFRVVGAARADVTGDGEPETVGVRAGRLTMAHGAEVFFESGPGVGGSRNRMLYVTNPRAEDQFHRTLTLEVDPRVVDLDGDGVREVVAPVVGRDRSGPSFGAGLGPSNLAVWRVAGSGFERGVLGGAFDDPIQGFHAARGEILVVTTPAPRLSGTDGESRLTVFSAPVPVSAGAD